jgi:hypothetical protein
MGGMAQPTPYTKTANFAQDETNAVGGRSTVRTAALDAELSALQVTTSQTLANLALIQRDDGQLADGTVKAHTLASDVRALFAASGGTPRGLWATATAYLLGDVVGQAGLTYLCAAAHTAGTFATDLAAGRWLLITSTTFEGSAVRVQVIPATEGQTVLNFSSSYTVGTNSLALFVDGGFVHGFTETSGSSATLPRALQAGQQVVALIGRLVTSGVDGEQVSFLAPGSGSAARTVYGKLLELPSVIDKGADATGVANSTTAFNNSTAVPILIPQGTYRTDTTPTGAADWIGLGAQFTGSAPHDAWSPSSSFGLSLLDVVSTSGKNALLGMAYNNLPASTASFPCGLTGYGRVNNNGNLVFGLFGRADLHATGGGVATNEVNAFNFAGTPSSAFPPSLGFGTTERSSIGLIVAAGGTHDSHIGVMIAREGEAPRAFRAGFYTHPQAVTDYGLFVDADVSSGPTLPVLVKHRPANIAAQFQGVGTPVGANAWLQYVDGSAVVQQSFHQNGDIRVRGNKVIGTRVTGWTAATGTATRTAFATGSVTTAQLAERVKALIDDLTTHGLIGT